MRFAPKRLGKVRYGTYRRDRQSQGYVCAMKCWRATRNVEDFNCGSAGREQQ